MKELIGRGQRMVTTGEVAYFLHVHPNTIRHWADAGLLRAYRLGTRRDRRFKQQDIKTFLLQSDGKE